MRVRIRLIAVFCIVYALSMSVVAQVPAGDYRYGYERGIDWYEWLRIEPDSGITVHSQSGVTYLNTPSSAVIGKTGTIEQRGGDVFINYEDVLLDEEELAEIGEWDSFWGTIDEYTEQLLQAARSTRSAMVRDTIGGIPVLAWSHLFDEIEKCRTSASRNSVTGAVESLDWSTCRSVFLPAVLDSLRVPPLRGVIPCDPDSNVYLPTLQEKEHYVTRFLLAAEESPLCDTQDIEEVYRFTWLRAFHEPVVIRVERRNEEYRLEFIVLSGLGGYQPGEIRARDMRSLQEDDWKAVIQLLDEVSFWSNELIDTGVVWATDGAFWYFEGVLGSFYRAFSRQSPRDGPIRELGVLLLELSDLIPDDSQLLY